MDRFSYAVNSGNSGKEKDPLWGRFKSSKQNLSQKIRLFPAIRGNPETEICPHSAIWPGFARIVRHSRGRKMELLEILQTIALCGGAIMLALIALFLFLISNYIGAFMSGIGTWEDDEEEELINPADLPEMLEKRSSRRKR